MWHKRSSFWLQLPWHSANVEYDSLFPIKSNTKKRFTDNNRDKNYYSVTIKEQCNLTTLTGEKSINPIHEEVLETHVDNEQLFQKSQDNLSVKSINNTLTQVSDNLFVYPDSSTRDQGVKDQLYVSREREVSACLQINYEDKDGNYTERQVRVISFNNKNCTGSFYGYCYLRKDYRTFRFDRVIDCIDKETREVISDIQDYLSKLYEESPKKLEDELLKNYLYVMEILYYVAKVDGQFRKKEKDIVFSYMKKIINRSDVDVNKIEDLFKKIKIPSFKEYKYAWNVAFYRGEVDLYHLKKCCHSIINTQKNVTPEEQEALDVIDEIINQKRRA